jgi:heme exporter protein D
VTAQLTPPADLEPSLQDDLKRYIDLAYELGKVPGRPITMRHLGFTHDRAKKVIAAADQAGLKVGTRPPTVLPGRDPESIQSTIIPFLGKDLTDFPRDGDGDPATDETQGDLCLAGTGGSPAEPTEPERRPVMGTLLAGWSVRWTATLAGLAVIAFVAKYVSGLVPPTGRWAGAIVGAIGTFGPLVGWCAAAASVVPVAAATTHALIRRLAIRQAHNRQDDKPSGTLGFYGASLMSMLVSVDTSWRFFEHKLGIVGVERAVMFTVLEIALIACGYGMRAHVKRDGRPGPARLSAWLLCELSAYMAVNLSGLWEGVARVALGPVLGLWMLHHALGIEIRVKLNHQRVTTWMRVARELRERALSWLGLADDERDAKARTRDRAACRAARLALITPKDKFLRQWRLRRALRISNVAHDPAVHARLLRELAVLRHAERLGELDQDSPWGQQ